MTRVGILAKNLAKTKGTLDNLAKFSQILKFPITFRHLAPEDYLNTNYLKKNLVDADIVFTRAGLISNFADYNNELKAISAIEKFTKIPVINHSQAVELANDKFRQLTLIASNGFKAPKSSIINLENYSRVLKNFACPFVIKSDFGYGGYGVKLVYSQSELIDLLTNKNNHGKTYIIQEFLNLEEKKDYRVTIVDNQVVGGVIREASPGDFRANVAQGGTRKFFKPPLKLKKLALKIFKLFQLDIGSVDFLYYNGEYHLLEVNPSIEIKDQPVAQALFKLIKKRLK